MAERDGAPTEGDAKPERSPRLVRIDDMVAGEDAVTLWSLLRRFAAGVFPPGDAGPQPPPPLLHRIRYAFAENAPHLREACGNSGADLLRWTRRGSPLRALLVVSVGTIAFLALTGLLVFMLFFLAATFNAIVISFLMSLAAAGGFLALLFACLTAIYIGALSVAVFILSIITISTVIAVLVTTGWIGFLWAIWLTAKKSMDLTKQSLSMTGSALSAYSVARQVHHQQSK